MDVVPGPGFSRAGTSLLPDYDPLANGVYPHIGSIWYADANLRYQLESLKPPRNGYDIWRSNLAASISSTASHSFRRAFRVP